MGDNEVCAVGRHLNPETLHVMGFGKAFDVEQLAMLQFCLTPMESIDSLIVLVPTRIIHLTIIFQGAIIGLLA
jgi:hypothetical protein